MPRLPADLHNAVVDVLKSFLRSKEDRENLLRIPAVATDALDNRITWGGTPLAFASEVVVNLTASELIAVLGQVRLMAGAEQHAAIDSFTTKIRQDTGGGLDLSRLIDQCAAEIKDVPPHILKLLLPSGIRVSAKSAAGLLREVCERELPDETPRFLILSVLNRLEHYFRVKRGIEQTAGKLRQFAQDAASFLGVPNVEKCDPLFSLIADVSRRPSGSYSVELFEFHEGRGRRLDLEKSEYSKTELANLLETKANQYSALWKVRVELAVSHDLLHEQFDLWQSSSEALGTQYPVVLRSRERMRAGDGTPAKTKWIRRHEQQGVAEEFCWFHKSKASGRITEKGPHIVVYPDPVSCEPDPGHLELVSLIQAGIAFAVWSRGKPLKRPALQCIQGCTAAGLPDTIFEQVRKQPKHPHQKSLVLLHDCYDRNPIEAEPFQLGAVG